MPNVKGTVSQVPGSYKLNDFRLVSQIGTNLDISKVFMELNIYEDIMSPVITGDISIADGFGLYNNFPIVGNEEFYLSFNSENDGTPQKKNFVRKFLTYKVSDKHHLKQDLTSYTIFFATPEYEENLKVKVSKAYQNKKASEIVKLLLSENAPRGLGFKPATGRALTIEDTFFMENFIIPFWSPFEAIEWLASRSLSDTNHNAANFVFFENRDGFNFVSIESLLKKTPKFTYGRSVKNFDERQKFVFGVENYKIFDTQDVSHNIQNGMYAGQLLIHDVVKKSLKKVSYDYLKEFDKTAHVSTNPLVSTVSKRNERSYSNYRYYPTHYKQHDEMPTGTNNVDKWMLPRKSLLSQLGTFRLVCKVKGNTEVQVGDVVNFKLMMQNPQNEKSYVPDKYHSGKYLITSIKHTLDYDGYYQNIEMIKGLLYEQIGMTFKVSNEVKDYILKQRTNLTSADEYYSSCLDDFHSFKDYLPTVSSILDIGCGIGGMSVVLSQYYGNDPKLWLFDKHDNGFLKYGYSLKDRFYNELGYTDRFLRDNDITNFILVNDLADAQPVGLIVSTWSLGWHYPLMTYYADVLRLLKSKGYLVVDIREFVEDANMLLSDFRIVKALDLPKGKRFILERLN